jgi:hypothetical protein
MNKVVLAGMNPLTGLPGLPELAGFAGMQMLTGSG